MPKRLKLAHKIRAAAWAIAEVEGWPRFLGARLGWTSIQMVRLRRGPTFHFYTPAPEMSCVIEVYCTRVYADAPPVPADGTVVDIGANIGTFAVYAAQKLVPRGRVVAIEPNPACVAVLKRNLEANGAGNVEVLPFAIGTGGGTARLHLDPWGSGNATVFDRGAVAETIEVQQRSPRAALSVTDRIDLLKVDCEGGEHGLVWETEAGDWAGVRSVIMEFHLGFKTGYPSDSSSELLAARLGQLGFQTELKATPGEPFGYLVGRKPQRGDG